MKGGLVVLAFALEALEKSGLIGPAITTVVLSPDEQAGSLSSRTIIEAAARKADWCFCMECARDGGNLMGSRAHIGVARLDVYGREAHAGSARASGISAIEILARKIGEISALTDPERGLYVTVGEVAWRTPSEYRSWTCFLHDRRSRAKCGGVERGEKLTATHSPIRSMCRGPDRSYEFAIIGLVSPGPYRRMPSSVRSKVPRKRST